MNTDTLDHLGALLALREDNILIEQLRTRNVQLSRLHALAEQRAQNAERELAQLQDRTAPAAVAPPGPMLEHDPAHVPVHEDGA